MITELENKVLDHLKTSVHNMGFLASMSWKISEGQKALEDSLKTLESKGLIIKVLVPVDYKNNIHYSLWTNDFNAKEEHLEGQVIDPDDFHELDSSMFEMKEAYLLVK